MQLEVPRLTIIKRGLWAGEARKPAWWTWRETDPELQDAIHRYLTRYWRKYKLTQGLREIPRGALPLYPASPVMQIATYTSTTATTYPSKNLIVTGFGAGGSGGSGYAATAAVPTVGGGGGGGAIARTATLTGLTLGGAVTFTPGATGGPTAGLAVTNVGQNGANGGDTTFAGLTFPGASGGMGGNTTNGYPTMGGAPSYSTDSPSSLYGATGITQGSTAIEAPHPFVGPGYGGWSWYMSAGPSWHAVAGGNGSGGTGGASGGDSGSGGGDAGNGGGGAGGPAGNGTAGRAGSNVAGTSFSASAAPANSGAGGGGGGAISAATGNGGGGGAGGSGGGSISWVA